MLDFLALIDGCSVHTQHGNKVAQPVPDAHKGFDHIRIKLAASTFYYFTAGLVKALGLAVWAGLQHGRKTIRNSDDACAQGNMPAFKPLWVTVAVKTFVVGAYHIHNAAIP